MNQYFIVRHGESENNLLEIDCAKLENKDKFGLTEKGKAEAESEARKYRSFDLIITSPLKRAKESAMIFAKTSQCEVIEDELLIEVDFGDYELCKYEESDAFFDKHSDESIPYPNGESLMDAQKRVIDFLEKTNQAYNNKNILIVTHGHIALLLIEQLNRDFDRKKAIEEYDDDDSRKVYEVKPS